MIKILLWPFVWPIKWILRHNKRAQLKMRIENAKNKASTLRNINKKTYYVSVAGDEVFIGTASQMKEIHKRLIKKLGIVWDWKQNIVFACHFDTKTAHKKQ